jgi:hypothetical protein
MRPGIATWTNQPMPNSTKELVMWTNDSSSLLRKVLLADAVVSGATGLLLLLGAGMLTALLGVPEDFMRYTGLSLLPFAALIGSWRTGHLARPAVWAVVAYNALWAVDSVLILVTGWIAPSALGYAFIVAQAAVVALLRCSTGLRRSVRRWRDRLSRVRQHQRARNGGAKRRC